ncbi:MAG: hypothetical protein NVS2B16_34460 [Chloroflexota bacterium]
MTGLTSPKRLLVVAATFFFLIAPAPSISASAPHGGDLHVVKECSTYQGLADGHCTITSSNLSAIPVGTRVVYLEAAGANALDSDIVLVLPSGAGNVALGHCTLPFPNGPGRCTFSGGTGMFKRFHASVAVTPNPSISHGWYWDGTYSFKGSKGSRAPKGVMRSR